MPDFVAEFARELETGAPQPERLAAAIAGLACPDLDTAILLQQLGATAQHVRLQVYLHLLPSRDDVVEWVRGTLLTDYQRRLPADLFDSFLPRYTERLLPALDDARPHPYPFKRLLLWARR